MPYQSFWVQNTYAPNQTFTISEDHKAGRSGTLFRLSEPQKTGDIILDVSSNEFSDRTFISFQDNGEVILDNADGYKLLH